MELENNMEFIAMRKIIIAVKNLTSLSRCAQLAIHIIRGTVIYKVIGVNRNKLVITPM